MNSFCVFLEIVIHGENEENRAKSQCDIRHSIMRKTGFVNSDFMVDSDPFSNLSCLDNEERR